MLAGGLFFACCLAYLVLLGYNSITRTLNFSPDSMIYVDVAQNFAAGHGLKQSVLMIHRPEHMAGASLYVPVILWAPLYPLVIGLVAAAGAPIGVTALAIPVFFCGVALAAGYLLMRRIYEASAAWLVIACLLWLHALRLVSSCAWSETMGIAALLGAFYLLARPPSLLRRREVCLAGVLIGLAYATRYALLPAIALAPLFLIRRKAARQVSIDWACLFLGFLLAAGPVFARNWLVAGNPLGPPRLPSTLGFLTNLKHAYAGTVREYLPDTVLSGKNQERMFYSLLAVGAGWMLFRRRLRPLAEAMIAGKRWMLPAWTLGYLSFLVVYRTVQHTDPIGPRLMVPALVTGVMLVVAWSVAALGIKPTVARYIALALAALACVHEVGAVIATPPTTLASRRDASARLRWIAENTDENDLIIGDSTMDIPLYCGFRHTVCFMPWQVEARHPRYEVLRDFLKRRGADFRRVFIVIRAGLPDDAGAEAQWQRYFGPFITDLIYGRLASYPGIRLDERTGSYYVFSVSWAELR